LGFGFIYEVSPGNLWMAKDITHRGLRFMDLKQILEGAFAVFFENNKN